MLPEGLHAIDTGIIFSKRINKEKTKDDFLEDFRCGSMTEKTDRHKLSS